MRIFYIKTLSEDDEGKVIAEYTEEVGEAMRFFPNKKGDFVQDIVLRDESEADDDVPDSGKVLYRCNMEKQGCRRTGCMRYRYATPCDKTSDVTAAADFYWAAPDNYYEKI